MIPKHDDDAMMIVARRSFHSLFFYDIALVDQIAMLYRIHLSVAVDVV